MSNNSHISYNMNINSSNNRLNQTVLDEHEIEEQNKFKEQIEKGNEVKNKIVSMLENKEKVSEMADGSKLNLGNVFSSFKNPIKRIIETAFTAKINADTISRRLKDASIKRFRDALQHLDFLRLDRYDLVQ